MLDVLLERAPWADDAAQLMDLAERGEIAGVLCATTLTTIYYVTERAFDAKLARSHVADLLKIFEVAPVTRSVLEAAVSVPMSDFEDAVLNEAGREAGIHAIVTRNLEDFASSSHAMYSPEALLAAVLPPSDLYYGT